MFHCIKDFCEYGYCSIGLSKRNIFSQPLVLEDEHHFSAYYQGRNVTNLLYIQHEPTYCEIDMYEDVIKVHMNRFERTVQIDCYYFLDEPTDEEIFQYSLMCDISMFSTEDFKALIVLSRKLSSRY